MPIFDFDGTTFRENGKAYDFDGVTYRQHGKAYDNDGVTNRLLYQNEFVVFSNSGNYDYTGGWHAYRSAGSEGRWTINATTLSAWAGYTSTTAIYIKNSSPIDFTPYATLTVVAYHDPSAGYSNADSNGNFEVCVLTASQGGTGISSTVDTTGTHTMNLNVSSLNFSGYIQLRAFGSYYAAGSMFSAYSIILS